MTPETTPLALGVVHGDGWHLAHPGAGRAAVVGASAVVVVLGLGLVAAGRGHPLVAVFAVPLALAFGALPFERLRPRVPPGLYAGDLGHGLLLPAYPMRTTTIASLGVLALAFVLVPVVAVRAVLVDDVGPGVLVAALVPLAIGVLLALGALGGARARRRPSNGLLLTPSGIVVGAQLHPTRFGWDDVRAVRPHWTVPALQRRALFSRAGDTVSNWLTFDVDPHDVEGPTPLAVLAGTHQPTLRADQLAVEPMVVLAVCRYYLEHPEARAELTTTAATDRVASVGRGILL